MGKLLMIQIKDAERIELLKKKLQAKSKVDVVRSALDLLEKEIERSDKIFRWKKAAKLVAESSRKVLVDFQKHSRLKEVDE